MRVFNKTLWRVLTIIFVIVSVLSFVLSDLAGKYEAVINQKLDINTSQLVGGDSDEDTYYRQAAYSTLEDLYTEKVDLMRQIAREGTVLLKNLDGTLPLSGGKIILLGEENFKFETLSAGGTMGFSTGITTLTQALEHNGFTVTNSSAGAGQADAALVVVGRAGGEGIDLEIGALALSSEEKSLIEQAKSCGAGKVIVLLSGDFSIEVGALEADDGIDAILKLGNAGYRGAYGLADVIAGASPSGRLVDTYAANSLSSPAMSNFGDYTFENSSEVRGSGANRYVAYMEGIYTDYKYYETRYEDLVLGSGNASSSTGSSTSGGWNYADEVTYPFGYGLSYTTFTQEIVGEPVFDHDAHTATLSVKVTNTGSLPGKEVVQVYGQSPYTQYDIQNHVEKASVQLLGYGKTQELEANGGSETLDITIHLQWLASYDYTGAKTYIMDAGDYYLALGNGAHDALNNILAAKDLNEEQKARMVGEGDAALVYQWTQDELDTTTYATSPYVSDAAVTNAFDDVDVNYWLDSPISYLSRSDWQGTFPKTLAMSANDKVLSSLNDTRKYESGTVDTKSRIEAQPVQYVDAKDYVSTSRLITLKGLAYDDPQWDALLDNLSIYDMSNMVANGRYTIPAAKSVSAPEVTGNDNPTGLWQKYIYSAIDPVTGEKTNAAEGMTLSDGITDDQVPVSEIQASMFCSEPVLAATFNDELAARQGEMFADDALYCGVSFTWGMGANIHRTPFGGRASEYFSADAVHSTMMGSAWANAAWERGHIMVVKHFIANEQEANRLGVCTFLNEQTLRENYLRAFEGIATYGQMKGLMSSYNRLGLICSAAEYDLMTGVLRNEWGSDCYTITDLYSPTAGLYDGNAMAAAGTNIMLNGNKYDQEKGSYVTTTLSVSSMKEDPVLLYAMRDACHRLLYITVNSMAMNGYSSQAVIVQTTPWYVTLLTAFEIGFTAIAVGAAAMYLLSVNRKKEA